MHVKAVKAKFKVDDVEAEDIDLHVVPDYAQPINVIVGKAFTELPNVAYILIDDKLVFGYSDL